MAIYTSSGHEIIITGADTKTCGILFVKGKLKSTGAKLRGGNSFNASLLIADRGVFEIHQAAAEFAPELLIQKEQVNAN